MPFSLLQAIAEVPEDALRLGLTHLQAAEFLYETSLFPELEYTLSGRIAEALPLLQQVIEQGLSGRARVWLPRWIVQLGEGYLVAGRMEEAMTEARRALTLARDYKQRGLEAWALRLLGQLAAQQEPAAVELAETHYRQATAIAQELGLHPLLAHCYLGLGTLYAQHGRQEEAHVELSAAITLYRAMEMTFWLPLAEAALAEVTSR